MNHTAGHQKHAAEDVDVVRKLRRADQLAASGKTSEEIAAELEVSASTLYNWARTYRGMDLDPRRCGRHRARTAGTRVSARGTALQELEVAADQWRVQDIAAVHEVFAEVGADPALARAWRASVVLSFAEVPETHPYLNSSVAGFLQKLYAEFPYLLYFLNPDRTTGGIDSFFASLGVICEDQSGIWVVWSDDVQWAYYDALTAAAEFAVKRGDDWVAVVRGYEDRKSIFEEIREVLIARGVIRT
jgi:Homeodomain-like domain